MLKKLFESIGFLFLNGYNPKEEEVLEFDNYSLIVKPKLGGN